MTLPRYAAKRDENEPDIVDALEQIGAQVTRLSGEGLPDLLVRYRDRVYAWEVKTRKGKRTKAQTVTQWPIIRSVSEALIAIGVQQ